MRECVCASAAFVLSRLQGFGAVLDVCTACAYPSSRYVIGFFLGDATTMMGWLLCLSFLQ